MKLKDQATILFQGDSITDTGRRESPDGLGNGYVSILQGLIAAKYPERGYKIINRGCGGDRTTELLPRWKTDCIDLKPDLLSLKIGVNDVWRLRGVWEKQEFVPFEEFTANYLKLIDQAKTSGIRKIVLLSPSAIEDNKDAELSRHLDERAEFVKKLAEEIKAIYVPIREVQKDALARYPHVKWTLDGCHPTTAGHALFAQTWLAAVKL